MPSAERVGPTAVVAVPEVRDYQKINVEVASLLDQGYTDVRLDGAEGQRLLASGLTGPWVATVTIVGTCGPEVGAGLDAPNLTLDIRGSAADGVARGLRRGFVLLRGDGGDGVGYGQLGGQVVVLGAVGHRAGLMQAGGLLVLAGSVGRLAGDRQRGGFVFARPDRLGPYRGRGASGGGFVSLGDLGPIDPADADAHAWRAVADALADRAADGVPLPWPG